LDWTVEYAEIARKQLRKLDKSLAQRIVDFMDERVAATGDPRRVGKLL
jgi:mRNA interferase RelE/StbE